MKLASSLFATALAVSLCAVDDARAQTCNDIQSGLVGSGDGVTLLTTGYDDFGYNYQAQMFNGPYACFSRDVAACEGADPGDELIMKWNDAWLSTRDCDGDGRLDRHPGLASYVGSGAWVTNHQSGAAWVNGRLKKWTYFVKIVAVPEDAVLVSGSFFAADGRLIGPAIWGSFAIVEEIYNDPANGANGLLYKGAVPPGFGTFQP